MHHGTTVVHWDTSAGTNRSARIYMRLEKNCSTLTWGKATWSALKHTHSGPPDYSLKTDLEDYLSNALVTRSSVDCRSSIGELYWITTKSRFTRQFTFFKAIVCHCVTFKLYVLLIFFLL